MNPWEEGLEDSLKKIIDKSSLSEDIRATITIKPSELNGTLNL